jgi:hypothetical protein
MRAARRPGPLPRRRLLVQRSRSHFGQVSVSGSTGGAAISARSGLLASTGAGATSDNGYSLRAASWAASAAASCVPASTGGAAISDRGGLGSAQAAARPDEGLLGGSRQAETQRGASRTWRVPRSYVGLAARGTETTSSVSTLEAPTTVQQNYSPRRPCDLTTGVNHSRRSWHRPGAGPQGGLVR